MIKSDIKKVIYIKGKIINIIVQISTFLTNQNESVIIYSFTKPLRGRVEKYKAFQRTLLGEKEDVNIF